ncbi:MAG: hypothetical protein AM326_03430 [Candidatus Thorarchaeota archaeon SMTZ-45]|nr:MAG: hypothetical protein AM326_03430 [Candidatus Thorarchaeota archaeon SMTZ-45]
MPKVRRSARKPEETSVPVVKTIFSENLDDGKLYPLRGLPGGSGIISEEDKGKVVFAEIGRYEKQILRPDSDPGKMTTEELMEAHGRLHEMFEQGDVKGFSTEDVVNLHALVVDELTDRGKKHPVPPNNGLDDVSEEFERNEKKVEKRYSRIQHSGVKRGERIELADVLRHFETFKLRKPYIYLVGGLANHGETEGDIDILVRDTEELPEDFKHALHFRLGRALPADMAERLEIHFDNFHGPFTNFVELYDLTFERVNPENEIKLMRAEEEVEKKRVKPLWSSSGGKTRLAPKLVEMLPEHKVYVEPFVGCGAVGLAKESVDTEVYCDLDQDIVDAFKLVKKLTKSQLEELKRKDWVGVPERYYKLKKESPKGDVERLYRFLYISSFAYGSDHKGGFGYYKKGRDVSTLLARFESVCSRLQGVKIESGDYQKVVEKYDSKETLFYFDPPYVGYNATLGERKFDEERFLKVLSGLKGKFLLTYGTRGKLPRKLRKAGFQIKKLNTPRHGLGLFANHAEQENRQLATLIVSNYTLAKKDDSEELLMDISEKEIAEIAKQEPRAAPSKFIEQADRAEKNDKLTLGEFFYQPKPTRPAFPEELQTVERLLSLFKERPEWFPTRVQKKFDGARHQIHVDGDKVKIISEDGEDNTARLPGAVKELQTLKIDKLVFDAEIEQWKGKQHLPREAVAGYLHSEDEPDDSDIVVNVFDVLYHAKDGDIHKLPVGERLKKLEGLGIKQSTMGTPNLEYRLNAAPGIEVKDLTELERVVRKIRKLPGSEGIVAKRSDADYPLKLTTPDSWVKYHNASTVRGIVYGRVKTKGGVWVYQYGVSPGKEKPQKTIEVKGKTVVPVGDTFATKRDFEDGDGILIEGETVNIERSPKGLRISVWVPRVIGPWEDKADTVDTAASRAKKNLVLQEKVIDEEGEVEYLPTRAVEKQADPYMEIPSEEKGPYDYTVQHHFRGKSLHSDLRIVLRPGKLLIGWTLNTQIAGAIKDPVVTLAQARQLSRTRMNEISKINWHTGKWAERPKAGTTKLVRTSILSERKAPEPFAWLNVEGKTKEPEEGKPPPVGGTKQFPGVFQIVDKGKVEYGSMKPWFHEYFVRGRAMNYRLIFRQLKLPAKKAAYSRKLCMYDGCKKVPEVDVLWADGRGRAWFCKEHLEKWKQGFKDKGEEGWLAIVSEKKVTTGEVPEKWADVHKSIDSLDVEVTVTKEIVLPPSEEQAMPGPAWLAMQPDDLTPYVLDRDAVKKGWIPPVGVSALPKAIRDQIPSEWQYWKKRSASEARKMRDGLVEAVKAKEVKLDYSAPYKRSVKKATMLDSEFVLQEQTWRGPIQIRVGPSRTLWWLRLDVGRPELIAIEMYLNPLDNEKLAVKPGTDPHKDSMKFQGAIKPGHYLNPTKETPSNIEILDSGKASVLAYSKDFIKVELKGKRLKGLYQAKRSDGDWLWSPSEPGPVTKEDELKAKIRLEMPIAKVDKEKHLVTGIVLEPNEVDAQGDIIDAGAIERAAHKFLAKYNSETRLGLLHKIFGENGVELVESWVSPLDFKLGGQNVKKGTWLMTTHVVDSVLWKKVKSGEITGFSIGGMATVV